MTENFAIRNETNNNFAAPIIFFIETNKTNNSFEYIRWFFFAMNLKSMPIEFDLLELLWKIKSTQNVIAFPRISVCTTYFSLKIRSIRSDN